MVVVTSPGPVSASARRLSSWKFYSAAGVEKKKEAHCRNGANYIKLCFLHFHFSITALKRLGVWVSAGQFYIRLAANWEQLRQPEGPPVSSFSLIFSSAASCHLGVTVGVPLTVHLHTAADSKLQGLPSYLRPHLFCWDCTSWKAAVATRTSLPPQATAAPPGGWVRPRAGILLHLFIPTELLQTQAAGFILSQLNLLFFHFLQFLIIQLLC